MKYFEFAVQSVRDTFVSSPACDPSTIQIDSLTIAADAMPHHFTTRAVIFDLQPSLMVRAICAVEDSVRVEYPHFRRTGWRAASDGLTIYFSAWTSAQIAQVA